MARRTLGDTDGSAEGKGKVDTVLSMPGGAQGLEGEHDVPHGTDLTIHLGHEPVTLPLGA